MKTLHLSITIGAPRKKVWDTMLSDATYREWTKTFNPGSYYKGDWSQGSKILFLGTDPNGKGEGGMVSRIEENRLHEFISIEHLGMIADGKEDTSSEMTKAWAGAHENYTFKDKDGSTELIIDSDVTEPEFAMMENMWKKGLAKLKELAEG
jgi:hypothetical protein